MDRYLYRSMMMSYGFSWLTRPAVIRIADSDRDVVFLRHARPYENRARKE